MGLPSWQVNWGSSDTSNWNLKANIGSQTGRWTLSEGFWYGLTRDLLNCMISYLTNRKQFAIVKGCTSQTRNVCCGMPQGSLLGPKASTPSSATSAVKLSNALYFEIGPAITNYHVPVQVQDHCHNHENQNVSAVRVPLKHPLVS